MASAQTSNPQREQIVLGGVPYSLAHGMTVESCLLRAVPVPDRTPQEIIHSAYLAAAFDMRGWVVVDHMGGSRQSRAVKPIYILVTANSIAMINYLQTLMGGIGYTDKNQRVCRWRIRSWENIEQFITVVLPFIQQRRDLLLTTLQVIEAQRIYRATVAARAGNAEVDRTFKELMFLTYSLHQYRAQVEVKPDHVAAGQQQQ